MFRTNTRDFLNLGIKVDAILDPIPNTDLICIKGLLYISLKDLFHS